MADQPAYLRTLESQLTLSNIGFGTMFTQSNDTNQTAVVAPVSAPVAAPVVTTKKLKFMLISTHLHQFTGYSKVSLNLINELSKNSWLDLTHFGFQRHQQEKTQSEDNSDS